MKKDKLLKKIAQQAVEASLANGKINPSKVKSFVREFKKLPQNKAIYCLNEYLKGLKRVKVSQTLVIESSANLSQSQIKKIEAFFKKTNTISEVRHTLNSSILGGVRIKIGDQVFDDSLESKIEQIGEVINA